MGSKRELDIAKTSRKQATIMGVNIVGTEASEVIRRVRHFIASKHKFYIVTPNPEQILKANQDQKYQEILNNADISIADGIGLATAVKFMELPNPKGFPLRLITLLVQGLGIGFSVLFNRDWLESEFKIVKGRELFMDLMALSNKKGWRIYLLGGESGEALGAKRQLENNFKNLTIAARGGPMLDDSGLPKTSKDKSEEQKVIAQINEFKPHLLFVGISFPLQEKWVYRWYKSLNIGGAMVVGGTFNYVAGRKPLPPKLIDNIGLEWLWRLLVGDQKGSRVIRAFPEFPLKIFWEKYNK